MYLNSRAFFFFFFLRILLGCESVHRLSRLLRNKGAHSCVLTNSYVLSMLYVSKKIARWAKDYRAGVQMGGRILKPRDTLKRVQSIETTIQQAIHDGRFLRPIYLIVIYCEISKIYFLVF